MKEKTHIKIGDWVKACCSGVR